MGVTSFAGTLALGVVLGFAGASFAIALPLASRWYPPEHQGKAMGLAGMGNSGTVLAALFAPGLAKLFGWNAVLGLACIPLHDGLLRLSGRWRRTRRTRRPPNSWRTISSRSKPPTPGG